MWGFRVGRCEIKKARHEWQGSLQSSWSTGLLDQPQFYRTLDGRPAIVDIELAEDALGMSANCAQADHEFLSDLRAGKLGLEQPENIQFALTEWLDKVC